MKFGGYTSYTTLVIKNGLSRLEALVLKQQYLYTCSTAGLSYMYKLYASASN